MAKFVAFILMGGPLVYFKRVQQANRRRVLNEIDQRDRRASGVKSRKIRGGRGGTTKVTRKKQNRFGL